MGKKILIIVENHAVPHDARVWKEACSLSDHGHSVVVVCPRAKGADQRHEVLNGVHIYRHPKTKEGNAPLLYLWEYTSSLFWEFFYACWVYIKHGFDVIQGCNPPDNIFLVALPFKLLGVKYIFDHHDLNPALYLAKYGKRGILYRIQVWLESLTYKASDVVMATNNSYQEYAIATGGVDRRDVFVVRNGPDPVTFNPVGSNQALKYGKPFLVGYVGNMGHQDGLDILLDVARYIKDMGRHDVHFTCVGGGPALPQLRRMVHDKDIADMVNFTGRVPDADLLEILSTADVCVNPDRPCQMNDKSTMIKIMEYMALSKPIVQFDMTEGRFSAGGASLYADNWKQVPDFAAKLLWLLDNPDERRRMGLLGRKRIEEELAWEYSVPNLLAAYDRAFEKKTRPMLWRRSTCTTASREGRKLSASSMHDR